MYIIYILLYFLIFRDGKFGLGAKRAYAFNEPVDPKKSPIIQRV